MTLELFDTHAHLNVDVFDENVDEVVDRAKAVGVTGIIVIGIDLLTSKKPVIWPLFIPGSFLLRWESSQIRWQKQVRRILL